MAKTDESVETTTAPGASVGQGQPSALDMDDGRVIFQKPSTPLFTEAQNPSPSSPPVQQPRQVHEGSTHPTTAASNGDTTVIKVNSRYSPRGKRGQKYLATGVKLSMRLWEEEQPGNPKSQTQRDYETVGYVIQGRAELQLHGQSILLEPGDSWIVPKGAPHRYKILEPFTAVEATCPPAEVHGRDDA